MNGHDPRRSGRNRATTKRLIIELQEKMVENVRKKQKSSGTQPKGASKKRNIANTKSKAKVEKEPQGGENEDSGLVGNFWQQQLVNRDTESLQSNALDFFLTLGRYDPEQV